jgi:large subunit ribosomal protein L2
MPIKKYRPITPGTRHKTTLVFSGLSKERPLKSLTRPLPKKGGRNNRGRITMRHRGGGHKRLYRIVDFRREKHGVPAKVVRLEYDPNRSANIALVAYADGEKRYQVAQRGLVPGDTVVSGDNVEVKTGNHMPLSRVPLGTTVCMIEMKPGKGAQIARSAGTGVQLMAKDGGFAHLKLPSSEVRMIPLSCYATIGEVGNEDHEQVSLGKAGRKRWLGRRPHVRGVAMNPVDHPMGGGEGRSSGGRHPCSPWGVPAKGYKTRKSRAASSRYIIRRRSKR